MVSGKNKTLLKSASPTEVLQISRFLNIKVVTREEFHKLLSCLTSDKYNIQTFCNSTKTFSEVLFVVWRSQKMSSLTLWLIIRRKTFVPPFSCRTSTYVVSLLLFRCRVPFSQCFVFSQHFIPAPRFIPGPQSAFYTYNCSPRFIPGPQSAVSVP